MDYPDRDELVVVKVGQILNYGVFVELLEYGNRKGFVHISNVSSSWVKNIRNLVKINQVRVAKVLNVDVEKKQIDLSFAGISPQMEKNKLNDFKQVNREEKLISLLSKQEKKDFDLVWKQVAEPLIEEYGSLFKALEKISLGQDVSKIIDKKWVKPVKEIVEKNIVITKKIVRGRIIAKTTKENGLDLIKQIFLEIESSKDCDAIYFGAGAYSVFCSAPTFKEAENKLLKVIEKAEKKAKQLGVDFSFKQENEKNKK
ncbi:MAG: S1 RNA-binding domain-containing protein [Candidatus ainarchaeum sp.]|nr:S1 RNA-binding domain-containing protein [Candidatus ainarchaeum sp.]